MEICIAIRMAARYLYRYARRYIFLLAALSFGFAVITVITNLEAGMSENVYQAGQAHYAGDLIIVGEDRSSRTQFRITETETVLQAVEEAGLGPAQVVLRTQFGAKGLVYFNGRAVRHKYVIGIDYRNEESFLESLEFASGGSADLQEEDILLSRPVADDLRVQVGDRVLLEVNTRTGQKNTAYFTVAGIVRDSSIFGYFKCFVARSRLNTLLRYEPESTSVIGLYFADRSRNFERAERLQKVLQERLPTGPLVFNRRELEASNRDTWKGIRHFVRPLEVYLTEVSDLLKAVQLIGYYLYAMMMLIIAVSVLVTYRLILHERLREIGTLRALGFSVTEVLGILSLEAVLLLILSVALGSILAWLIELSLGWIDFSIIPGFEIFLKNGKLSSLFEIKKFGINVLFLCVVVVPCLWIPAAHAVNRRLRDILFNGDL